MGMGMSVSPQIWQQFVDLVFQDDLIKRKQNFDIIMDDTFIHSTAEEHMDDHMDLFKVLRKYGLKLSPHKCQFFKNKIVYMGLEFQVQGDKVCYTPLKDKCDAIRNLESPKTLRQTRAFCGMVNFLSSFLPNLCRLLISKGLKNTLLFSYYYIRPLHKAHPSNGNKSWAANCRLFESY